MVVDKVGVESGAVVVGEYSIIELRIRVAIGRDKKRAKTAKKIQLLKVCLLVPTSNQWEVIKS